MSEKTASQNHGPRAAARGDVRLHPKVALGGAFGAGRVALVMFSSLFLHAAVRNGWGPFGGM